MRVGACGPTWLLGPKDFWRFRGMGMVTMPRYLGPWCRRLWELRPWGRRPRELTCETRGHRSRFHGGGKRQELRPRKMMLWCWRPRGGCLYIYPGMEWEAKRVFRLMGWEVEEVWGVGGDRSVRGSAGGGLGGYQPSEAAAVIVPRQRLPDGQGLRFVLCARG